MRRIMLMVIDSLHPRVIQECLHDGKVPALAFLAKHGSISSAVSTFPTMTPTASATIATGTHCDLHQVPGFVWYDDNQSYYVNYGASPGALLTLGPVKAFTDLFYNLNDGQLSRKVSTIYEELEKINVASACVNFFIRRGGKKYKPKLHWLMNAFRILGLKKQKILGPKELVWGEIIRPEGNAHRSLPRGIFNKFGVNDKFTSEMVCHLINTKKLPQFSIVFFPDNDRYSHVHGPMQSHSSVQTVDKGIGKILSAFGSWERALKECHFIVVGDHAQSPIGRKNIIRLDKILAKYKISPRRWSFGKGGQIIVSANERMAAINIKDEKISLKEVIDILADSQNIGLIMWKSGKAYNILSDGRMLTFLKGGNILDKNGGSWEITGDLSVIGARIQEATLDSDEYPDALERISAALDYGSPNKILLSALYGYEYYVPGAPIHPGGGSHGSLHREDSVVPVISSGQQNIFSEKRTLDLKKYVLRYFKKS